MKYSITLILSLSLLIMLTSCGKSDPDPINVVDVEQEFEVFPIQEIGESGPELLLVVRATESDSCLNSSLLASMIIENDNIIIDITGVVHPEVCDAGSYKPEQRFLIPTVYDSYSIEFQKDGFESTSGHLTLTDNSIDLNIDDLGGIFVTADQLQLLDENHIWGYVYIDNPELASGLYNLEEIVSEFVALQPSYIELPEGDYSYFEVLSDGTVQIDGIKDELPHFAYEADEQIGWEYATGTMLRFLEGRPALRYHVFNGKGEEYFN